MRELENINAFHDDARCLGFLRNLHTLRGDPFRHNTALAYRGAFAMAPLALMMAPLQRLYKLNTKKKI